MILLVAFGCGKSVIEKPDNLIDEEQMVNILYDLSLLESIRSQRPIALETNRVDPLTYVYKKYKIDSLQFAKSNKYYATDVEKYKAIYASVSKKIEDNKAAVEKQTGVAGDKVPAADSNAPQVK